MLDFIYHKESLISSDHIYAKLLWSSLHHATKICKPLVV